MRCGIKNEVNFMIVVVIGSCGKIAAEQKSNPFYLFIPHFVPPLTSSSGCFCRKQGTMGRSDDSELDNY